MALQQDERAHPTLGASLNQTAFRLTALSARLGPRATVERDLQEALRAQTQFIEFTPRESIFRKLFPYAEGAWRARINVMNGEYAAALEESTRIAAHVRKIEIPPDDLNAGDIRANFTRNVLLTAATAAIKSNRYPEGETAARELLELPPDPVAFGDPKDDSALARMLLGHAIALLLMWVRFSSKARRRSTCVRGTAGPGPAPAPARQAPRGRRSALASARSKGRNRRCNPSVRRRCKS